MAETSEDDRDRFRELAEQQESDAARHEEAEQLLRRTISRLCVATTGLDHTLDPHLTKLKQAVHQGYSTEVQSRLNDLSDAIIHASEERKSPVLFERFIGRLGLEVKQVKKAQDLWSQLAGAPSSASDEELDELSGLLGLNADQTDITGSSSTASTSSKGGILSNLFGGGGKGSSVSQNKTLADVLGRIKWPAVMTSEIDELRSKLINDEAPDAWIGTVEHISSLVSDALDVADHEVRLAEQFLSDLTLRLEEIDQHISTESGRRETSADQSQKLGDAVKTEVGEISRTVGASTDIEQLRETVLSSLDRIQRHVDGHLEAETRHRQESEKVEQQLRGDLDKLEHQAFDLRREIIKIQEKALRDPLTGLANRRAYDERLTQEYARWRRFSEPLVILIFDIDNFKKLNDRLGHKAGDKALQALAAVLQKRMRATDFIARYGGEEFVVILSNTNSEGAFKAAEEMRKAVEQAGLHSNNKPINITVSGGLSGFQEGDVPEKVFERADKAMYAAKKQGKNRCIIG